MNGYTVTLFTQFPLKSWATQAVKASHVVHTRGSVTTWTLLTLVDICSKKERAFFRVFQGSNKMLRSLKVCFSFIALANRVRLPVLLVYSRTPPKHTVTGGFQNV